jgi:hypothetical protein
VWEVRVARALVLPGRVSVAEGVESSRSAVGELRAQEVAMLAGTGDVRVEARAGCEGAVGMGDERRFQAVRIYKD